MSLALSQLIVQERALAYEPGPSPPSVLVTGNVDITCLDTPHAVRRRPCGRTSRVCRQDLDEDGCVLKQPPFTTLPPGITGKQSPDAGLRALQELHNRLSQEKRALGLIMSDMVPLVTVTASPLAAPPAWIHSVQSAKSVQELAQNTSTALHAQEDGGQRLETQLNAWEAGVGEDEVINEKVSG